VKKAAIAVSISLGLAPSTAFADDWSIKAIQSETVEANSNQFLAPTPAGTLGSYTTLSAEAEALTPDSKFDFDANGTYRKYWGPGTENTSQTESTNWGFKAHYELDGENKFDKEFVEAGWQQQSTAFALLNDLGISSNVDGALDRLTATGEVDRSLSALDSVSLIGTSTFTSFEPTNGGVSFTDTLGRGTWQHSVSHNTALTTASEVELLNFDNAFSTDILILRDQAGINASLSSLLSFRGEAGAIFITTNNGVGTSSNGPISLPSAVSSSGIDWIGNAVLTYKMFADTTVTFNAGQSIGPSVVGSLFKRDTMGLGINYTINSRSTLSLFASGNRQTSTTTTDFVSTSMTYSYNFTREWTAQLTYRYLHRFSSSGTATIDPITDTPTVSGLGPADSHGITVVVSHNLTVLPHGN
jgi:hypothetical protein